MKNIRNILVLLGVVTVAGTSQSHEAHKHVKAGSSTTASTTAAAKASLPAASVSKVELAGELIDPQCWFTHNGEGKSHAACAVRCAKGGQDLAFLDTGTGELHSLIARGHGNNPNDGLYDNVGVPVRVRGTLYRRGSNSGLLLEDVTITK